MMAPFCLLALLVAQAATAGPDVQGAPAEGAIVGRITSSADGSAVRRARVQCSASQLPHPRVAISDESGRFECRGLPPGRYLVSITRTGFAATLFGQTAESSRPVPIDLRPNQVFDRADVSLARQGAITGQVTDENGAPLVDVLVTAGTTGGGRRERFAAVRSGYTDDEGVYRIWGLRAGKYLLKATPADLDVQSTSTGIVAGTAYYPGVPVLTMAQPIEVRAGIDTTAVNIGMTQVRLGEVSGRVVDSLGRAAAGARGVLVRIDDGGVRTPVEELSVAPGSASFRMIRLAPAEYEIVVLLQRRDGPPEAGSLQFTAAGERVEGLTLTTSRAARVSGRIAVAPGSRPLPAVRLTVTASAIDPADGELTIARDAGSRPGTVDADGAFDLPVMRGRRLLNVDGLPRGWAVAAVVAGDRDITAVPLDLAPGADLPDIRISITTELAGIAGQAVDRDGHAAAGALVVVFPAERSRWRPGASFIYVGTANQEGRFSAAGMVPGSYVAAAVDGLSAEQASSPSVLEWLQPQATPVRLEPGRALTLERPLVVVKRP